MYASPARRSGTLAHQYRKDIGDGSLLDGEAAIHVGFAETKLRVHQHAAFGIRAGETHRQRLSCAVSDGKARASCGGDPKISCADHVPERPTEQPFHRPPLAPYPAGVTRHAFDIIAVQPRPSELVPGRRRLDGNYDEDMARDA